MGRDPKPRKSSGSASPRAGATRGSKPGFNDYRFVKIELTQELRGQFKALQASDEFAPFEGLTEYVRQGYKCSFSEGDGGKSVICSLSCHGIDDPNRGLILTGRGPTASTAWDVVRFKSLYLCQDEVWATGERDSATDDWLG